MNSLSKKIETNPFGLQAMAYHILEDATRYRWTIQGFGMLRLDLYDNVRLHVWSNLGRVPNVSDLHDHLQWGLLSQIIFGRMTNQRFREIPEDYINDDKFEELNLMTARIRCGFGARIIPGTTRKARLFVGFPETYLPGDVYSQEPSEIHRSVPDAGTVSIVHKFPTATMDANIFWPIGEEWISAEPRVATREEIEKITGQALSRVPPKLGS